MRSASPDVVVPSGDVDEREAREVDARERDDRDGDVRGADAPAPVRPDRDTMLLRAIAGRIDPRDPGALNNLGVLYSTKGRHTDAVDAFRRALALAPRMHVAARNLAIAARRHGACEPHLASLTGRLREHPDDHAARRDLAQLLRLIGRAAEARAELQQLLDAGDEDARTCIEFGLLEQDGGDLGRAERWYERALACDPDDAVAQLQLAEVSYHQGRNARALELLDRLVASEPALADAHLLRSFVLGDVGRHEEAVEASRRATALNPALSTTRRELVLDTDGALAAGDPAPASVADASDEDHDDDPHGDAASRTEAVLARAGMPSPATSMLGVVADGVLARYTLGLAFRQRGYWREARAEFERALEADREAPLVRHALAELDLVEGRTADAIARFEALLAERDDDARLWCEHGVARHQAGELEAAAASYRRALRADPRHAVAYHNLGVALDGLGERAAAREALQRAAQLDPALVASRLDLARILRRDGDPRAALALLRDVTAFHDGEADGWFERARAARALGMADDALDAVVRAIECAPDHAEARYLLATLLGERGDADGALRETQQALRLAPMRRDRGPGAVIALQRECPDTAGRVELLALGRGTPLSGTRVDDGALARLLSAGDEDTARDGAAPAAAAATPTPAREASSDRTPGRTTERAPDPSHRLADAERVLMTGDSGAARRIAEAVYVALGPEETRRPEGPAAAALLLVADAFAADGMHGEARERYEAVRRVSDARAGGPARPSPATPLLRRAILGEARTACLLGDGARAVPLVERLGSHVTGDVEVLALLAATHAALGDAYGRRTAHAAITRLLARAPSSAALLHFAGDAARQIDEPSLALSCYRLALARDPSRPSPRLAVAQALIARGDHAAAHLELVATIAAAPRWREAVCTLADLHALLGRPADGVRVLARHLGETPPDADVLARLAALLRAADRPDDARRAVQRARRLDPDAPRALLEDGHLLAAQGRVREARSRWGRLVAVHPSHPCAAAARDALGADGSFGRAASAPSVASPPAGTPMRDRHLVVP